MIAPSAVRGQVPLFALACTVTSDLEVGEFMASTSIARAFSVLPVYPGDKEGVEKLPVGNLPKSA